MTARTEQERPQGPRTISLQPSTAAAARRAKPDPVRGPWRFSTLMAAPHRLGFALAMLILIAASFWWFAVQIDRVTGGLGLGSTVPPTLTHAAVMVLGFMPLFFSGFLFTAGPNWLRVAPPTARYLLWPLALQTVGWLLWLTGAHTKAELALIGLLLALAGLGRTGCSRSIGDWFGKALWKTGCMRKLWAGSWAWPVLRGGGHWRKCWARLIGPWYWCALPCGAALLWCSWQSHTG